ncbi:MAG: hypothetical protein KDG55_02800 [Rhodocyclaceae bacterium]|nr:hypothetical protein [Rhodocyclaceae bacterium]
MNFRPRLSLCGIGPVAVTMALALGACTPVPNAPIPARSGLVRTVEKNFVHIAWGPGSADTLSAEEQERVTGRLRAELSELAGSMPYGWNISPTIRNLETVRPAVNALSALLIIVPISRGGIELDFVDHRPPPAAEAVISVAARASWTEIRAHLSRVGPALACIPIAVAQLKTALEPELATSGA